MHPAGFLSTPQASYAGGGRFVQAAANGANRLPNRPRPALRVCLGLSLPERHGHVHAPPFAHHSDRHSIARPVCLDGAQKIVRG